MKYLFLLLCCTAVFAASAQSDSLSPAKAGPRRFTHQDTVYMMKLNNTGNLMIAGGVGLCGVGIYLIYEGTKIYGSAVDSATATSDTQRNHKQGTIYEVAGGIAIAGGIALVAFGAKNKVDFKIRKKFMTLQAGVLDNGHLGLACKF